MKNNSRESRLQIYAQKQKLCILKKCLNKFTYIDHSKALLVSDNIIARNKDLVFTISAVAVFMGAFSSRMILLGSNVYCFENGIDRHFSTTGGNKSVFEFT